MGGTHRVTAVRAMLVLLSHRKRYEQALQELTAGYEMLMAQANPSMSWIEHAREEMIACFVALGDADRAAELRAEAETTQNQTR